MNPELCSNDISLNITVYCKNCKKNFQVTKEMIFGAGDLSKYATRCPNCNFGKKLPFKDVIKIFGNLEV